ncbi:MAG: hypothetical protein AB8W37_11685 [Arsenophonus endosymbiont of Dermacentor nuttalli]
MFLYEEDIRYFAIEPEYKLIEAKNRLDIAAQGDYLYAQAMEETEHFEEKHKKCNRWTLCLTKKTEHHTHHEVKNKVTEFHAGNDINLLSYNDSFYEATKINTQRNTTLTSTHGRIYFKRCRTKHGFNPLQTHGISLLLLVVIKGHIQRCGNCRPCSIMVS